VRLRKAASSFWACAVLACLAGCTGLKTYPNAYDKNAVVRIKTDSGTFLSRTRADLDLYTVNAACGAEYLGSLTLGDASVDVGLPLGSTVLLAYVFSRSSFLGGRESASVIEMMVAPRKGYRYEFEVSYVKNTYGATGLEFVPGRPKGREIEHQRLKDCAPKKL
jgi:hypothetical protein